MHQFSLRSPLLGGRACYNSRLNTSGFSCCCKGDIQQPLFLEPPDFLKRLLQRDTTASRFRDQICAYNNALTFTSCSYTQDPRLAGKGGIQPFQIQGELYHLQGPLEHVPEGIPCFAQNYIIDPKAATVNNKNLDRDILKDLDGMLRQCNPFIHIFGPVSPLQSTKHKASPLM